MPSTVSRYRMSPVAPGRSGRSVTYFPLGRIVRLPGEGRFPPLTNPNNLFTEEESDEFTFEKVESTVKYTGSPPVNPVGFSPGVM